MIFDKFKKRSGNRKTIPAHGSIEENIAIPLEAFPPQIRDLMIDPIKNKDEIIKRMNGALFMMLKLHFQDESGKDYAQRFKINLLTLEIEKIDKGPMDIEPVIGKHEG